MSLKEEKKEWEKLSAFEGKSEYKPALSPERKREIAELERKKSK